jgi:hypothetical protein
MPIEMPEIVMIRIDKIRPNDWNPNEMRNEEFDFLVGNFEDLGFVQPVLVAPLENSPDGFEYSIIDGEHRFLAMEFLEEQELPCIIRDIDIDEQMFQTVRMNKIKGTTNQKKLMGMVNHLMENRSIEEVAAGLAYSDASELEGMIASARESLPDSGMKKEFDRAKDAIKTVDDLTNILNRLFTRYGDTLPAHFMVLDFGGKDHIWVKMAGRNDYKRVLEFGRTCLAEGVTMDSVILQFIAKLDAPGFIERFRDTLDEAEQVELPPTHDSDSYEEIFGEE